MGKSANRLVSDAILGTDTRVVSVGGRSYVVRPPTIHQLAGAAGALDGIATSASIAAVLLSVDNVLSLARALSWFIVDGDSLCEALSHGTIHELQQALQIAYGLISVQDFMPLLTIARNVASLTAKARS